MRSNGPTYSARHHHQAFQQRQNDITTQTMRLATKSNRHAQTHPTAAKHHDENSPIHLCLFFYSINQLNLTNQRLRLLVSPPWMFLLSVGVAVLVRCVLTDNAPFFCVRKCIQVLCMMDVNLKFAVGPKIRRGRDG
jgi:hypothetical protein